MSDEQEQEPDQDTKVLKHRVLVEVSMKGDNIIGASVQVVGNTKDDDPDEGRTELQILEKNMSVLTTGLVSLMHHGHLKKLKDSAKSMKDVIEELNVGHAQIGDSVSHEDYKKKTDNSSANPEENGDNE